MLWWFEHSAKKLGFSEMVGNLRSYIWRLGTNFKKIKTLRIYGDIGGTHTQFSSKSVDIDFLEVGPFLVEMVDP